MGGCHGSVRLVWRGRLKPFWAVPYLLSPSPKMKMRSLILGAAAAVTPIMSAAAQQASLPSNVISIQPLSAMYTVYSGEFERRVGQNVTLGVGGTYWDASEDNSGIESVYTSGDVKLRYYPGVALRGFSFGASAGYTQVKETTTGAENSGGAPTFGLLLEYQWLLGARSNMAVTLGAGAKKLFVDTNEFVDVFTTYPTARISIGWGF